MPFSEIKLILDSTALKWMKKLNKRLNCVKRLQNAYPSVVVTSSLGSDPLILESPMSACTRPLVVANVNDDEIL